MRLYQQLKKGLTLKTDTLCHPFGIAARASPNYGECCPVNTQDVLFLTHLCGIGNSRGGFQAFNRLLNGGINVR